MPLTEFTQGVPILKQGEPLSQLLIITKGFAEASINGRLFRFEQGDIIGLCALATGVHNYTYNAASDLTAFPYPFESFGSLDSIMYENAEASNIFVNGMCRQMATFLQYRHSLKQEASRAYEMATKLYPQYERLSNLYALTSKKLSGLAELVPAADPVEDWLHEYYTEIKELEPLVLKGFFRRPGIALGFMHKGAEDMLQVLESCVGYKAYLEEVSSLFLSPDHNDLFALMTELHFNSLNIRGADETVEPLVTLLANLMSGMECIHAGNFQERLGTYNTTLAGKRASRSLTDAPSKTGLKQNLSDSLNMILAYSNCPEEVCNQFARKVQDFTKLPDRGSSEDVAYRMRRELTELFYTMYQHVFIKSLADPAPPTVIKMFLNFGYVDADLAGHENADYLYSIADSLRGDPERGVYTIPEWLTAIYHGQKEPSRNDFDEDYAAHVRELRRQSRINEQEEKRMLADQEGKLRFELESVFPVVNKITYGRISTFCPLFTNDDVQRSLETCIVTPAALENTLADITKIDFSAYCRQTLFSNPEIGVPKEDVHLEVLPNFILTPNVGTRGAMWQEIDGRVRSTPARMFLPMFFLGDFRNLLIQLTAEFRWEMCKRIQGVRWSDLSDPSLTSEFFTYLQFYRSNRDLSTEAKTSVKTELVRAKNVYKAVFVSNYMDWLMYECNGSPRLNKVARNILFTYCPFSQEVREKLSTNPQYSELLRRYDVRTQQRANHLDNVVNKITKSGKAVPPEIANELKYIAK